MRPKKHHEGRRYWTFTSNATVDAMADKLMSEVTHRHGKVSRAGICRAAVRIVNDLSKADPDRVYRELYRHEYQTATPVGLEGKPE